MGSKLVGISIAIVNYPGSLKSAVYGLYEMFKMANRASTSQHLDYVFEPRIIELDFVFTKDAERVNTDNATFDVVVLPPSDESDYYLHPHQTLIDWLTHQHSQGAILTSACAGTFILSATRIINEKNVTTHWGLESLFLQTFPSVNLDIDKILIHEGDVITAGGMMSWLDLGFEIVAQFAQPSVMRQLGKLLVVDTGQREQRFYQQFSPSFNHGDSVILGVQQALQTTYHQHLTVSQLAEQCCLTERTFLRRFVKATQLKPTQYIQHLRVQKACELLETTPHPFEWIANQVGYEDVSACRKIFVRTMGLTPGEFKKRFVNRRR